MGKIIKMLQGSKKWEVFFGIMFAIMVVGTLLSLWTKVTFIKDDPQTRPRIAVVATAGSEEAKTLKQGVELLAEQLNAKGGVEGRNLEVFQVDDKVGAAEQIVADKRVIGVVGHMDDTVLEKASKIYAAANLPVVTPRFLSKNLAGVSALGVDGVEEAKFAANYARNIQQQRLMYVVKEKGVAFDVMANQLTEVYAKFDTPVKKTWEISDGVEGEEALRAMSEEFKSVDVGAVYVAASPKLAARIVTAIRKAGNSLEIVGSSQLTTTAFIKALGDLAGKDKALFAHGITAATPVIFDTANEEAQKFKTNYQKNYSSSPDWLATLAYDAAKTIVAGTKWKTAAKGLSGDIFFDENGQSTVPLQMGVYNGEEIISAPVQLTPISKGASFNYIEALRQGRVLYANDRFMFKTNVVYTGFTINEISDLDAQKATATLDMSVWFRFRGKFDPQDLQVANSVEPVKFEKPEESKDTDDVQYRRYRIKQKFKLNFTDEKHSYDRFVAGIEFKHRLLNKNNLMYVVDVLGMPTGKGLAEDLTKRKVTKAGLGWMVEDAWVSQNLEKSSGDGAPQYVGMTGEQAMFSTITMGILLKPAALTAQDVIDKEYFVYLAIFGVLGVLAAQVLDIRKLGRFMDFQSWLMRVIFFPMLLLASGNLLMNWSYSHFTPATTRSIVLLYASLWWVLGAMLLDMAINRFVWIPLELRAGRKIPNVMKVIVTILVYAFAIAGITAVVMNQTLTSLLATSGVLVMIVGLAIQANIANVFSGIVLNIERPFRVGDYIKINNVVGEVKDITWRTIRIESNEGPMVSLANSKVSEAFMENLSLAPNGVTGETLFYTTPDIDPNKVLEIIANAIENASSILYKDHPALSPSARFKGVVNVNGQWVACFSAGYRVQAMPKKSKAKQELWMLVRKEFLENGIDFLPANGHGFSQPKQS
jgi:potassium efflux system protein